MIKVCHMTSAHPAEDIRIFHKECVSLARAGYEVYLVERGASYEKNGVHIVGVGEIPSGRLKRMTEGAKRVYEAAKAVDADIYHFHDPELLPYGLKLKRAGKRVIFDSHEDYARQIAVKPYLPRWIARLISHIYTVYERRVLRDIDAVIFPCTIEGRDPFSGKCRCTALINNVPLLQELPSSSCSTADVFSAGYVGPIRPDRGNTQNVQACEAVDVPLLFGGTPDSEAYQQELERLDSKGLVTFCGQLDRAGVWKLLSGVSVGLVTELSVGQNNTTDNLPTKTYEYMAAQLPFLIANYPYAKKVVDKHRCGICVDPENVAELAHALTYLRDHPDEARQMGENGRRAVKEEFNWDVEEKKLLALYEDILNEK